MVDRERILAKIAELKGYLGELKKNRPKTLEEYKKSELKRRACERVLQISIECALDICDILFSGLNLGVPASEEDIIEKLNANNVLSNNITKRIKGMRATRNVLVHRYPYVDDEKIFESLTTELKDFDAFINDILKFLGKTKRKVI